MNIFVPHRDAKSSFIPCQCHSRTRIKADQTKQRDILTGIKVINIIHIDIPSRKKYLKYHLQEAIDSFSSEGRLNGVKNIITEVDTIGLGTHHGQIMDN